MRHAGAKSKAWALLRDTEPDLALLQEVSAVPAEIRREYSVAFEYAAGREGRAQTIGTELLCRGELGDRIELRTSLTSVNPALQRFRGNLVAHKVSVRERDFRVLSA